MAKINKHELSRGVMLAVEHYQDPIEAAQNLIHDATIAQEQMERGYGTFHVDLWTPHIASDFIGPYSTADWKGVKPYSIPFMLPPTQDFFDISAPVNPSDPPTIAMSIDTPIPILTEVVFSFDQRGEGAAIADTHYAPGTNDWPASPLAEAGTLDYENASKVYNMRLSLMEKTPEYFQGAKAGLYPEPDREVFSYEMPADAFIGASFRANPFVVSCLDKALSPYKTYIAMLDCTGLFAHDDYSLTNQAGYVLCSMTISLKFRTPLGMRDEDDGAVTKEVQNIPLVHQGLKDTLGGGHDFPVAGDIIVADGVDGVSHGLDMVDKKMRKRLRGGYSETSEARRTEIQDDSVYDVISAVLYSNGTTNVGGKSLGVIQGHPYAAAYPDEFWDRVIIPIKFPFVLHHVILAWNWQGWSNGYRVPGTPAAPANLIPTHATELLSLDIGVNLGCGLQSDSHGYMNIAQTSINAPLDETTGVFGPWLHDMVDRVKVHTDALSLQNAGKMQREWDLFHVPIVTGDLPGKGYGRAYDNGSPVWCGPSNQITAWNGQAAAAVGRSNVATVAPSMDGLEQFIEVRARMYSQTGVFTALPLDEIAVGYGGHRVYLIGKKHLAAPRSPR